MVQKLRNKLNGKEEAGFTLIELMIVVAIIGILAAIAIPNFTRFQLKAKSSEGKVNVAAIRTAQAAYAAEFGEYVTATASPTAPGGSVKIAFVDSGNFGQLGWAPEGSVFFSYETSASAGNWYNIGAEADIDGSNATPTAADSTNNQQWGYFSNDSAATAGSANGCSDVVNGSTTGLRSVVGPCDNTSGQSKF